MGKGIHGGFKNTEGRGVKKTISDNLASVTQKYPLTVDGLFGKAGHRARIIESNAPVTTAYDFFNRLTDGYDMIKPIPYPDGSQKGCVAYMKDGAIVTVRKKSTSDGSPAVDINIKSPGRVKTQKIHFTKKEDE